MSRTYEPIATTTLSSDQAEIEFTSISGSFTDIILVAEGYGTITGYFGIRVNNDSGTNYSRTYLYGTGSAAASGRGSNLIEIAAGFGNSSTNRGISIMQFMNYSNSTTNKTILIRDGSTVSEAEAQVGLWRNTAAITSIKLSGLSTNLGSGSTFTLYGIKAA